MEQKKWNPLADIASVLGSIAQKLPPLPKPPELPKPPVQLTSPELPTLPELPTSLAPHATSVYIDVRDPLMVKQMEAEQKRQAERGLVTFVYE